MNIETDVPTYWESLLTYQPLVLIASGVGLILAVILSFGYFWKKGNRSIISSMAIVAIGLFLLSLLLFSSTLLAAPSEVKAQWTQDTLSNAIEDTYGIETSNKQLEALGEDLVIEGGKIHNDWDNSLTNLKNPNNGWNATEVYGHEEFIIDGALTDVTLVRNGDTLKLVYSDSIESGTPIVELPKA